MHGLSLYVAPGTGSPPALRNKWAAITLLVLFFVAFELFDLWATPWWTAWIIVAYFLTALAVDTFFQGAAFCKYVCPLGQFNFVGSLVSPGEIKIRRADTCAACRTKDFIAGNSQLNQRGCELWLFQEKKVGNMDCIKDRILRLYLWRYAIYYFKCPDPSNTSAP